jgi:hypothetical protein
MSVPISGSVHVMIVSSAAAEKAQHSHTHQQASSAERFARLTFSTQVSAMTAGRHMLHSPARWPAMTWQALPQTLQCPRCICACAQPAPWPPKMLLGGWHVQQFMLLRGSPPCR